MTPTDLTAIRESFLAERVAIMMEDGHLGEKLAREMALECWNQYYHDVLNEETYR
jgi:hypothetical protein